ncbi:Fe2+-dependent dioxygenase [Acinetobacter sp. MD2(2019)]|uniref:Fe2+-dependent dioxygenase n=1 Tax=Acinetobacter sp. MD2(2019) TaxID=2605273 RepID=UPI002D1F0207|nr:Fe2+-dependent dioxygenase [Acinetobacter sp. MD2(2019)]MEB3754635.1 Fe2+-dependent dioxygenase [Acinetobacter sp. MD2(2019)]
MLLHVPNVLNKDQVQIIRQKLQQEQLWISGKKTAGTQAQNVKDNLQLNANSEVFKELSPFIADTLRKNPFIHSFALPNEVLLPLFNLYQNGGHYGNHVDSAIHYSAEKNKQIRTDVSITLFLSEPNEYEGGELIIEDTYGEHEVKLDAGDAVIYPATSLHRVEPVTQGMRICACTWIQSMIKDDWQRSMLFNLDKTIMSLRQQFGDTAETAQLTHHYHNLLRQWGDV